MTIAYALQTVSFGSPHDEGVALEANRIVRKCLDKRAISYKDYKIWRQKNHLIFTSLVDEGGNLLGFLDIFPLNSAAGERLVLGELSERTLSIDDILPLTETDKATHIHIATILTNPRQITVSDLVAREVVILKMGHFIAQNYSPLAGRTFTAYAQTRTGETLLKRCGFQLVSHASDNEQNCPLYILRAGQISRAVSRFERANEFFSIAQQGQVTVSELDLRMTEVELGLRRFINSSVGGNIKELPQHVLQKANERVAISLKKNPAASRWRVDDIKVVLEFFDLRELQDTIVSKNLWPVFQPAFPGKEALIVKFDQLCELRNCVRHSRTVGPITLKEGEASIIWFEAILRKQEHGKQIDL